MNIAIIPDQEGLLNNKLFEYTKERDNVLEKYYLLKAILENKKHIVETIDKFDYSSIDIIIFQNLYFAISYILKCVKVNPNIIIINNAVEPLLIDVLNKKEILKSNLFDYVLTWNDDLIDNIKYFEMRSFCYNKRQKSAVPYNNKKYLCVINYYKKSSGNGEIYSERERAIKYFCRDNKLDLYGVGWEKHHDDLIKQRYKGSVNSKLETMKHYKYSLAYENCNNEKGYISEKIFDSFSANCIPIFYGPDNVQEHIPENTFIDFRKFSSYNELEMFLDNIDEKRYNQYLNDIKIFMESNAFKKYTSQGFSDTIISLLENKTVLKGEKNLLRIKLFFVKTVICDLKLLWKLKLFILKVIIS